MLRLRKRFRVILLAALVAAVVVPVGFALSLETPPPQSRPARMGLAPAAAAVAVSAPVLMVPQPERGSLLAQVPEAAKLFFVGSVLFGLAIAVRKAS